MKDKKQEEPDIRTATAFLSGEYIRNALSERGIELSLEAYGRVDSTNTLLKRYAGAGEQRDMVVLAEEQSGGRGRRGRSFYSPVGTGLYMSLLLHPQVTVEEAAMLTTLAAVATVQALEAVSEKEIWIKWVNDILIDGKKAVGILTESSPPGKDGRPDYVVVGIGINLYEPEGGFPAELADIAGTVFGSGKREMGMQNRTAVEVLTRFMAYYRSFPRGTYLEEYKKHSYVLGKRIRLLSPLEADGNTEKGAEIHPPVYATAVDIDEHCHLKVCYEDGRSEYLSNGEVSIRL